MLTGSLGGRDLNEVLQTLCRYDRLEQKTLQYQFEDQRTGDPQTREKTIFYLVKAEFDPSRLSYDAQLRYQGEPVEYVVPPHLDQNQMQFDEFGD
jgi:hypothetical protein